MREDMMHIDDLATMDYACDAPMPRPVIWWRHGVEATKTPGVFYCRAADVGQAGAPWAPVERYEGEAGFQTERLGMIVVRRRQWPFTTDDDRRYVFHEAWQPGMRLLTQFLAIVDGINDPVVISLKGVAGQAFTARSFAPDGTARVGIMPTLHRLVVQPAQARLNKPVPLYAFRFEVVGEHRDGKPVFARLKHGPSVTLPALALPALAAESTPLYDALFVGAARMAQLSALYVESEAWARERPGAQPVEAADVVEATAHASAGDDPPAPLVAGPRGEGGAAGAHPQRVAEVRGLIERIRRFDPQWTTEHSPRTIAAMSPSDYAEWVGGLRRFAADLEMSAAEEAMF